MIKKNAENMRLRIFYLYHENLKEIEKEIKKKVDDADAVFIETVVFREIPLKDKIKELAEEFNRKFSTEAKNEILKVLKKYTAYDLYRIVLDEITSRRKHIKIYPELFEWKLLLIRKNRENLIDAKKNFILGEYKKFLYSLRSWGVGEANYYLRRQIYLYKRISEIEEGNLLVLIGSYNFFSAFPKFLKDLLKKEIETQFDYKHVKIPSFYRKMQKVSYKIIKTNSESLLSEFVTDVEKGKYDNDLYKNFLIQLFPTEKRGEVYEMIRKVENWEVDERKIRELCLRIRKKLGFLRRIIYKISIPTFASESLQELILETFEK